MGSRKSDGAPLWRLTVYSAIALSPRALGSRWCTTLLTRHRVTVRYAALPGETDELWLTNLTCPGSSTLRKRYFPDRLCRSPVADGSMGDGSRQLTASWFADAVDRTIAGRFAGLDQLSGAAASTGSAPVPVGLGAQSPARSSRAPPRRANTT
jgi:hypothetical protein